PSVEGRDPGEDTASGEGGMPAGLDWFRLVRESKPLIAAVNGAAVGIGMTMILPFDVIVASEKARFGMLFIKVGLVPELASTHFLVQRVGLGKASEMCLSGRLYGAAEAAACGLADRLVEPEKLLEAARELAREIAANPDPQLRMTKALLTKNASATDLDEVQRRESEMLRACRKSPERDEPGIARQVGEHGLQVEVLVRDVEGEHPRRGEAVEVQPERFSRQEVHRDRVGAVGIEDDQIVASRGPRQGQPRIAEDDARLRQAVAQVGEVLRIAGDSLDERIDLVQVPR